MSGVAVAGRRFGGWGGAWRRGLALAAVALATTLAAAPVRVELPAQSLSASLLALAQQAGVEVLFPSEETRAVPAPALAGLLEPEEALAQLLRGTGFTAARKGPGKFAIRKERVAVGAVRGVIVRSDGTPAAGLRVELGDGSRRTVTDGRGEFLLRDVPAGSQMVRVSGEGFRPLEIQGVEVAARRERTLPRQTILPLSDVTVLDPYVVEVRSARLGPIARGPLDPGPRVAAGNLDLPRTANDPLPYTIYYREQLERSGVVNLNEFFQREVLDADATKRTPGQSVGSLLSSTDSGNLTLRGFGTDETIVLVNGRRLPEAAPTTGGALAPPDVDLVPLSLVQQVEVMPASAAALYSGNAVGGVINIVLRPDIEGTEVTTTYTNALRGFSAPEATVSLQHGEVLLGGALRLRLNATVSKQEPATERDLRLRRPGEAAASPFESPLFRATPNIRSADQSPLFGAGPATVTSVAPGADGKGGLAAFNGREGVRSLDWFDLPDGRTVSLNGARFPYGRSQQRMILVGSVNWEVAPWLELGFDGTYARTVSHRGYDVFAADLALAADSPLNPFGRDVRVALNDAARDLGARYNEAHFGLTSAVLGALVKLPGEWRAALDGQVTRSVTEYRGLAGVDEGRWQSLVDEGRYNPLRDTQRFGPPAEWYDRVLVFNGVRGEFLTTSDYSTLDAAVRLSNQALALPTGRGALNVGFDYRRNHLAGLVDAPRYGDGAAAADPQVWQGRTIERYSVFGEVQAPLLPQRWLPAGVRGVETDAAARYVAADTSRESNLAPAAGLKVDFAGGISLRGSITTANRYPTPYMRRRSDSTTNPTPGPGAVDLVSVFDPVRGEQREVERNEAVDPNLLAESAVTKTVGVLWQRGQVHRVAASLDLIDTRKDNELVLLDAQAVVNLESTWPARVVRTAPAPGDPHPVGPIGSVTTGVVNAAWRHSQNWNAAVNYAWTECRGGTLELYGRMVMVAKYDRQVLPDSPVVDEIGRPDGTAPGLLRYRANAGASWSNARIGFGVDGRYYHSRELPQIEWASQGGRRVGSHWQMDAFVQGELGRWLPWARGLRSLRAQLRIANLLNAKFPRYANDPTGAGVQPYGDWRGRTYSLSLTAAF